MTDSEKLEWCDRLIELCQRAEREALDLRGDVRLMVPEVQRRTADELGQVIGEIDHVFDELWRGVK